MAHPASPVPPKLLMLSHCVPTPEGSAARVRAWQLLCWAGRTHQVYLAALSDGPFNLEHWRQLRKQTQDVLIEPLSLRQRPWATVLNCWDSIESQRTLIDHRLRRITRPWRMAQFDTTLCTHPILWTQIDHLLYRHRVCDLAIPQSVQHQQAAQRHMGLMKWWHQRQSDLHRQLEISVARRCNWLLLQRKEDAAIYHQEPCDTILLPSLEICPPFNITGQPWNPPDITPDITASLTDACNPQAKAA